MSRPLTRRISLALPALVLLALPFSTRVAAADESAYYLQAIAQIGGKVNQVQLPSRSDDRFFIGALTDNSQIGFGVGRSLANRYYQGGYSSRGDWLFHYAKGVFTPIVAPGDAIPGASEPSKTTVLWPFGMNQSGSLAFSLGDGSKILGTYVWDAKERRTVTIAQPGVPAPGGAGNATFNQAGGWGTAINSSGEVVFTATIKDPNGPDGPGLFFFGRDGKMLPIVLPGQTLADGKKLAASYFPQPSINDAGAVAFLAQRQGDAYQSAFLWEQGNLTPVLLQGTEVPGGKIRGVSAVFVNNRNRNLLVTADLGSGRQGVYRIVDGKVVAVVEPGQTMPGAGKWRTLQNVHSASPSAAMTVPVTISLGISAANTIGQHVLLATLEDGSTAAYRMDANGKLYPVLKSGQTTTLGTITKVGVDSPVSINASGLIALSVRINGGVPTLVMLTPKP